MVDLLNLKSIKKVRKKTTGKISKQFKKMAGTSKLEDTFAKILTDMGLNFERYYIFKGREYDFFLPDYNLLIETHGCFFHCCKEDGIKPKYQFQKNTIKNDRNKSLAVKVSNGYKLLVIWEHEINKNRKLVIEKINESANLH